MLTVRAKEDPDEKRHPIRVAATRAGLTPSVVRVWEARYGAVEPGRTESGQRRYSDRDVDRLRLLNEATNAGRRISDVVSYDDEGLRTLVSEDRRAVDGAPERLTEARAGDVVEACVSAVEASDDARLRHELDRAALSFGATELVDDVVSPLMKRVGEMWRDGRIDPAHEHLATMIVRQVLTEAALTVGRASDAPRIVVATPAGQVHEIGALEAAVCAAGEGWSVVYLGPDLPAESIARAAREAGATAVALSIVFRSEEFDAADDIRALRSALGDGVDLLVGGRAAVERRSDIEAPGVRVLESFADLRAALARAA